MRIRRRPQAQALSSLQPADPSTAPQPPPNASRNQQHWLSGGKEEEEEENKSEELHLHPNVDLGDDESSVVRRAALPLLPQDNVLETECGRSLGGAQRQGPADGHRRLENGHHNESEPVTKAGEGPVNGLPAVSVAAVNVNVKEEIKNDSNGGGGGGVKKRRGPAVLMEGSRCSRVNGRGWRCSQPTLVGYSLCEHHLGKGRMRSVSGGRGGAAQLGRTEPRKNAAAVPLVKANETPSVRHW